MKTKPKALEQKRLPNWLIVSSVLVGAVLLTWMTSNVNRSSYIQKEREGFEKAEAAAAATVSELSSLLGEPLYVDRNNACSLEIVGKNPERQLYCDTIFAAYYSVGLNQVVESVDAIKSAINKNYPPAIVVTKYDTSIPSITYMFGSQEIDSFNSLNCAMSIRYPEKRRSNHLLPERSFNQNNILSIAVHCDKHVRERVY